jgi:hypothetical protein
VRLWEYGSNCCRLAFHDEIFPRLNIAFCGYVVSPATGVRCPTVRSRIGTVGNPSASVPMA